MDEDFLLKNDTAVALYRDVAEQEPIIDFHNHLDPKEIYEDECYDSITDVWLSHDHYKWRAMRANGVSERLITGDADPYDKFLAWADTVENLIGNPLYHWTHLELLRYFDISTPLSKETARKIYDKCNEKLRTPEYSVRNLLRMQKVSVLCTTDDPADELLWHKKLRDSDFEIRVLPSFRPEKAVGIEKEGFLEYIDRLSEASQIEISDVSTLLLALEKRLDFFVENGCRVSDHSMENTFFIPSNEEEADAAFKKRMDGGSLSDEELGRFHGFLYSRLAGMYHARDMVMQLHIGAIRNNSKRNFKSLGVDSGFDAVNDFSYAAQLSALLDAADETDELPRTIIYCLNQRDVEMCSAMAGSFCANEDGIRGKVQAGAAWWFCDHKNGIERQIETTSDYGLLSAAMGMLTDSRSFLSFPRHEYYRRILCNKIGQWVEDGEYPDNMGYLKELIRGICSGNAMRFFRF